MSPARGPGSRCVCLSVRSTAVSRRGREQAPPTGQTGSGSPRPHVQFALYGLFLRRPWGRPETTAESSPAFSGWGRRLHPNRAASAPWWQAGQARPGEAASRLEGELSGPCERPVGTGAGLPPLPLSRPCCDMGVRTGWWGRGRAQARMRRPFSFQVSVNFLLPTANHFSALNFKATE